jgi:hypothetical protein
MLALYHMMRGRVSVAAAFTKAGKGYGS